MDLLKNNTSLKKYFGIIKTKKHRPPRASLTQGRPTSAVNTGSGNWGPPRVRATPSKHSCRDHDAALTGRQECTRTASLCPWKGFSCVTWIICLLSFLLLYKVPSWFREAVAPRGQRWRPAWNMFEWDIGFFSPCDKKSGASVLCGQICIYRTKNTSNWEEACLISRSDSLHVFVL